MNCKNKKIPPSPPKKSNIVIIRSCCAREIKGTNLEKKRKKHLAKRMR